MTSPSLRISHAITESASRVPLVISPSMAHRVIALSEEVLQTLKTHRDRIGARSLVRASMALIGEPVSGADANTEKDVAGEHMDESDFADCCHNAEGLVRKIKEAVHENERENVIAYLKSLHRLLGNGTGSGSLTPRPRDYAAAMSRFSEGSMSSPAGQRASTHMERLEHAHSQTHIRP